MIIRHWGSYWPSIKIAQDKDTRASKLSQQIYIKNMVI